MTALRTLIMLMLFGCAAVCHAQSSGGRPSVTLDGHFKDLVADTRATMLANPKDAVIKAGEVQRYAAQVRDVRQRELMVATAEWLRGEANIRMGNMAAGAPLVESALRTASRIVPGSTLEGDALLSSGWVQTERANAAQALADYQAAHDIFQKLGNKRNQAKALIQIASLYSGGNDYPTALRYYDQAIAAYDADPQLRMSLYNNRGNVLKELGRYRDAELQFGQALVLAHAMNSRLLIATVLCNLARSRLLTGRLTLANQDIVEGMRITATGEAAEFRPVVMAIAAQAAFQEGALRQAEKLIDARFRGVDLSKTTLVDRDAHETAYRVYQAVGRADAALQHLAALKRLDDEATKLARSTNAALMAARFDFANQELKIANLQRDEARRSVAYEQARARTQQQIFLGIVLGTAIVIALLGFGIVTLRRSRNQVRAANDDLEVTNNALGKALAAKTEFLATTSHEIRTPLNGILGMTQVMLADATLEHDLRDRLKVVHGAGLTMCALVDDILDVAKMEAGNLAIEQAPFDLHATIAESTRLWEDQARAKGVRFARNLAECPTMIVGDAARTQQIVFNLLSNALKFTAEGAVTLTIGAVGADRYRISVSDTGIGIPAEKVDEIFESFRQADTSTTRHYGGTGLGLSICRKLAQAMGGDIGVSSVPGQGSTFTVELPLVPAPAPAAACEPGTPGDTCLLIVDRNPITRSMLKTLTTPHATGVELASSLADATARLATGGIAQVLVDGAVMQEQDAADLLRSLVALGAPVTMLWPLATLEDNRETLLAAGVAQIVAKPVSGTQLVATLFPADSAPNQRAGLVPRAA